MQEKESKTPISVKSVKKEVAEIANDVATPVVEAVMKRVRKLHLLSLGSGTDCLEVPKQLQRALQ